MRLAAYRDVLTRHDIPFDPAPVAQGEFIKQRGYVSRTGMQQFPSCN